MDLLIDGYNLLHVGRSLIQMNSIDLQRERDRLMDKISLYQRQRPCEITVVFDGWRGGWATEKREMRKGIELVFSKRDEKADEVIKRMARAKGTGVIVITSDREIARYAERLSISVIPSDQFLEKLEKAASRSQKGSFQDEEEERGEEKKGPSRRLSKKERRRLAALKKL